MISSILLMAGTASRMNMNTNKVLLPLGDKLVYEYSLEVLLKYTDQVILVINENDEQIIKSKLPKNVKYTFGGNTRGQSVYNGLKLADGDYIIIHDGARPFISDDLIKNIITMSKDNNPILCYQDVKNTIKINDNNLSTLDRTKLISAVTPQCATKNLFIDVYEKSFNDNINFTDDISLIEKYYPNQKINLIKADDKIFKITTKIDYSLAKAVLEND